VLITQTTAGDDIGGRPDQDTSCDVRVTSPSPLIVSWMGINMNSGDKRVIELVHEHLVMSVHTCECPVECTSIRLSNSHQRRSDKPPT
jgi:hypothetical protein